MNLPTPSDYLHFDEINFDALSVQRNSERIDWVKRFGERPFSV